MGDARPIGVVDIRRSLVRAVGFGVTFVPVAMMISWFALFDGASRWSTIVVSSVGSAVFAILTGCLGRRAATAGSLDANDSIAYVLAFAGAWGLVLSCSGAASAAIVGGEHTRTTFEVLLLVALPVFVIGSFLGIIPASFVVAPLRVANRQHHEATRESCERFVASLGTWFVVTALTVLVSTWLLSWRGAVVIVPVGGVLLVVGIGACVVPRARRRRRDRWVEAVARGRVEVVELVPMRLFIGVLDDVPRLRSTDVRPDAVVLRCIRDHVAGAYRTGEVLVPIALVTVSGREK